MNKKINQQRQQTLFTSKTLCPIKKILQKLKIASDKSETKQNTLYFTRKDMIPLYKKAR